MLEFKLSEEPSVQKALCAACGISFDEPATAYLVEENGVPVGICRFRRKGGAFFVESPVVLPRPDACGLRLRLGQAVLLFAEACGVQTAYYEGRDRELADALGFAPQNGRLSVKLREKSTQTAQKTRDSSKKQ